MASFSVLIASLRNFKLFRILSDWWFIVCTIYLFVFVDIMTWFVAFDASANPAGLEYVLNLTTEIQYRWAATPADSVQPGLPAQWMKSYEGYYNEGYYSIVI